MAALTFEKISSVIPAAGTQSVSAAPAKASGRVVAKASWFSSFLDALMESRMRQAEREIQSTLRMMRVAKDF